MNAEISILQINVKEWLRYLDLEEYVELFQQEGYKWECDMGNMKNLDEAQLKAMGINKKGGLLQWRDDCSCVIVCSSSAKACEGYWTPVKATKYAECNIKCCYCQYSIRSPVQFLGHGNFELAL